MTGKTGFVVVRKRPEYPFQEIMDGIAACGDHAIKGYASQGGDSNTAIITWHPYGRQGTAAHCHLRLGGRHIVIENGYVRKDAVGEAQYCVEFDGFNGQGWIPKHGSSTWKWARLGAEVRPWRQRGDHILVCGQRGGDYSDYSMPMDWPDSILDRLSHLTDRPIKYRPHPGRPWRPTLRKGVQLTDPRHPIYADLEGAHACVVWCSNAATEAIISGVPVFYQGPSLKLASIACDDLTLIEDPPMEHRGEALAELAWSQWSLSDLKRGDPWRFLMYSAEGRA